MDVPPEWGQGALAAPEWWLNTWARRLVEEHLTSPLGADVLRWLDQVARLLRGKEEIGPRLAEVHDAAERKHADAALTREWLALAADLQEEGSVLEARVAAELS